MTPRGEWRTNEFGVSLRNLEDFGLWNWGDVSPKDALACVKLVTDTIHDNAMATISFEHGFPEIEARILSFEYSMAFRLQSLVEEFVADRSDRSGLDAIFRGEAQQLLADLDRAAATVRDAIAASRSVSEPLVLD